jgi:predicted proteasome-type protease
MASSLGTNRGATLTPLILLEANQEAIAQRVVHLLNKRIKTLNNANSANNVSNANSKGNNANKRIKENT